MADNMGEAMMRCLAGFVAELRASNIPVSLTENLDAMRALMAVPIEDRESFKYALAATMVKNASHWDAFETVFDVYFSLRSPAFATAGGSLGDSDDGAQRGGAPGPGEAGSALEMTAEQIAAMIYLALRDDDGAALSAAARAAVTRHAGMEPGRPMSGAFYLHRTLRQLDLQGMLGRLVDDDDAGGDDPRNELDERLRREEFEARVSRLRSEVDAEIRRRLVADRGPQAVARSLRRALPEEIDFMHATREELVALRRAVVPLARRLAVRLERRRRHRRRGPLDFRSTIRHSLSYGGVPAEPRFRAPRPAKPEIMVVADISGSVAAFARFTLQFVYAISSEFSRVRSFVFIDGVDEVTDQLKQTDDIEVAMRRIHAEADVIWADGHSDYGHAFEAFWERFGPSITSRTTVLFLGDARNNYHASQDWVLAGVAERARHVFWLNPEPRSYWDTGDSIASRYALHCEGSFECRNLRQLGRFVEQLA